MNEIEKILESLENLDELKEFLIEEIPDKLSKSEQEQVSIVEHATWNRKNPIVPAVRIRTSDVRWEIRSVLPKVFQTDTQEVARNEIFLYIYEKEEGDKRSVKVAIRKVLAGGNA